MDLSPGGSIPPVTALAGCIVSFFTRKFYHAHSTIPRHPSKHRPSCARSSPPSNTVISPASTFPAPAIPVITTVFTTSDTGHPDRSRPALLLFCFAPAKQPACEVEGSLFRFLPLSSAEIKTARSIYSGPFLFFKCVESRAEIRVSDKAKIPAQT